MAQAFCKSLKASSDSACELLTQGTLALDDIGYVQHDRAEMEVLFELLAQRYERKSVMITSNLGFSKWDQTFCGRFRAN